MNSYFAIAFIAFLVATLATYAVRAFAFQIGFVDVPDGRRKTHRGPVALGGGLAVLIGAVFAVSVAFIFPTTIGVRLGENLGYVRGLGIAVAIIAVVGFADDWYGLRGRQKLLGQLIAAFAIVASGLVIDRVRILGAEFNLGVVAIPITVLWLLLAINSLNLIDGIDGLASTLGIIISLTLAGMCVLQGKSVDAVLAIALAGALCGFLGFNLPPARIFLGDTGSMLIGLSVGSIAIHSAFKAQATVGLLAPLALLSIPLLDSLAAIVRRKLTGRSIYATDRGHLHHCFIHRGWSNWQTLVGIGLLCAVTCIAALVSVYLRAESLAAISVIMVVSILVSTRMFGYAEFMLVRNRMASLGRSLLTPARRGPGHRGEKVQIQGTHNWDAMWDGIHQTAVEAGISRLRLDVNLPRFHESYHAHWESPASGDETLESWYFELPVLLEGQTIGRLDVKGAAKRIDPETGVALAALFIAQIRDRAQAITASDPSPANPPGKLAIAS